jgi:hypothetical protein
MKTETNDWTRPALRAVRVPELRHRIIGLSDAADLCGCAYEELRWTLLYVGNAPRELRRWPERPRWRLNTRLLLKHLVQADASLAEALIDALRA